MFLLLNILFTGLLLYYLFFLFQISHGLNKVTTVSTIKSGNLFVSVIIPFRNESHSIIDNLNYLENQNYPNENYEVIYINDDSTDDSLVKLKNAITKNNIYIYSVDNSHFDRGHKKRAIKMGIERSQGEIVLLTDADALVGSDWISAIMNEFDDNTGLVSGPVKFNIRNNIFEKIQQLEFAGLILAGAGLIGNQTPIICSSANLAFRKKVYEKVGGYKNLLQFSSGDDELLMQKIANDTNYDVKFCFNKKAVTVTRANKTFGEFSQQRKRWASKTLFYKNKKTILKLIVIYLFYVCLFLEPILGLFYNTIFINIFLISFLVKIIVEYSIIRKGIGILYENIPIGIFFITELLHIPYIIFFSIGGIWGNFTWKERKLAR